MKTHLLRICPLIELNERILQRIARLLIPNDLTAHNSPKPRKDQLQILIPRHTVQFTNEQYVLRWANVGKGEISDHF